MSDENITRRLTTIAAADVAGYSRLVSKDEEGTLSALRSHRAELIDPLISEFHGRIANTAGDSLLIEFPSVVEALRCCMEIQRSIADRNADIPHDRRIEFRIGINLGDVIEQDGDLLGAGVNVAARLEGLAEPGGICISRAARDQVRDLLDVMLEDMGEVAVKNITRPVRTFRVLAEGAAVSHGRVKISNQWPKAMALIVVAAVIIGGLSWWRPWTEWVSNPLPQSLSIVVLPFDNLSADPAQSYFADAVTEDLITDLSRIRGAFVIARGTSFTFKGKATDAKKVASELNVRYVLEGSVRRAGDTVRVNVQLIDGTTGAHIWSDRFDRKYTDAFSLQNDITGRIAATLKGELLEAQSRALKSGPPANLKAWDYALQGTVGLHQSGAKKLEEVKALFEKALELDPELAFAWTGMAHVHYVAYRLPVPGISVPHSNKLSLEAAQKAVSLDGKSSQAFNQLGYAYRAVGQIEKAVVSCETAVELNPNNSDAYLCLGTAIMFSGKPAEAISLFEKSAQLNPRHRPYRPYMYIGLAYSLLERYKDSVKAFNKSVSEFPNHPTVLRGLASGLAKTGRIDEARVVLAKYLKLSRGKRNTIEKLRAYFKHPDEKFERLLGGLRLAGMPER